MHFAYETLVTILVTILSLVASGIENRIRNGPLQIKTRQSECEKSKYRNPFIIGAGNFSKRYDLCRGYFDCKAKAIFIMAILLLLVFCFFSFFSSVSLIVCRFTELFFVLRIQVNISRSFISLCLVHLAIIAINLDAYLILSFDLFS